MSLERTLSRLDVNLLTVALIISSIGAMLVYSATHNSPDSPLFAKQVLWSCIGIGLMIVFVAVDYHALMEISPFLYAFGMCLLAYVLVFGRLTRHVRSWIHIGGFQFQPSEFMKIFTALLIAKYFDSNDRAYLNFRNFVVVMMMIGGPVILIALQPAAGSAASFFPLVGVAMFFGGIKPRYWVIAILCAVIAAPIGWHFLKPFQKERIKIFLDPSRDPLGTGYQVMQAKIATGSGGTTGKGFLHGTQVNLEYLPARHTDFIFSVLGEEWGFV
ncbi:MAG TPA: FtsW/RodA/SpoVE family cell cycle protein, partial [Thermoanaerobaculia bacterium]|nr:FtsW/RodA/SpoVE family cell cycle protein [Thermoanaerobaculia bacterium]